MQVDVTMTATRRPEVLYKTLYSFSYNLLGKHDCRAIVNVDPVGSDIFSKRTFIEVIREFFSNFVLNFAEEPNFSKAFKWTWLQVQAPWVFHLEDDWRLEREVYLETMINLMKTFKNLASLRLPQFKSDADKMKNWNLWFPWNGVYFECPDDLRIGGGFCGHPSLIRGDFVKTCAPLIDTNKNPEKQFHHGNEALVKEHLKWRYGVYGQPNQPPYVTDLGRAWMVKNGWKKKGNKATFMVWEKEESK